jgi:hypothetical protein
MKHLLFALFILLPFAMQAGTRSQEYKASNGVVYHVGDKITLSKGSMPNGAFKSLQYDGAHVTTVESAYKYAPKKSRKSINNSIVTISQIRHFFRHDYEVTSFIVEGDNMTQYNLLIEDAISTCEITPCK